MQLHLRPDPHERPRLVDSLSLRASGEVPFSRDALRAMRIGLMEGGHVLPMPVSTDPSSAFDVAAEHRQRVPRTEFNQQSPSSRLATYERDRCGGALRCGFLVLLLVGFAFVAVVVTMMSMVFVRVGSMMETMGGSSMHAKMDSVLDHALLASMHTEAATANAAAVSALARSTAEEAHPRLIAALNQTSDMMADLRDFSSHPSWTITGGLGGRRLAGRD